MDDESSGSILSVIRNLFRKSESPLEEHLLDAVEEGEIKSEDVRMLQNVLELEDRRVAEVMVPRPDIICAEVDSALSEVADLIAQHGHSRIPIYEDNRDHILGIVHAKDILMPLLHPQNGAPALRDLMRPCHFVPETTNLKQLLHDMQSRRTHMAVVLDEYGGTAGVVTLEDVLEQIVGEIGDEYDALRPEDITQMPDGSQLVSGRVSLDEVNTHFGLELSSEQVETIGGHLCELAGRIPAPGESYDLGQWRFVVQDADVKHIETIRAYKIEN